MALSKVHPVPKVIAVLAALVVALPVAASAGSRQSNLHVDARVALACFVASDSLQFGAYTGDYLSTTARITVTCNDAAVSYVVSAGNGLHMHPGGYYRGMRSALGPGTLYYGIYTPGFTWFGNSGGYGNTNNGLPYAGTTAGGVSTQVILGWIDAGQMVPQSTSYQDQVTLTVHF